MSQNDIYPGADLVQTGPMRASDQAGVWRDDGVGIVTRVLLCELAIGATVLAVPAHAQSMQRVDLVGFVEPRCSAVTPAGLADPGEDGEVVSRALTVRCSGQSPALSVRTQSPDETGVTLTVAAEQGMQTGQRLSTREGNVVVGLADLRTAGARVQRTRSPVEIIVAPTL